MKVSRLFVIMWFVLCMAIAFGIFWLTGKEFVRSDGMAFTAFMGLVAGCLGLPLAMALRNETT